MPSSPSQATEHSDATIPLLVQMPDGSVEQVDVPTNAPVNSISAALSDKLSSDVRFSFANMDLHPDATLLDCNIVDAYAHANSLLTLVNSSSPDADTKAAALDSINAVVERVSNGVKSMSALCAAAAAEDLPPHASEETAEDIVTPEQLARSLTSRLPKLFGQEHDPLADVPPPQQPSISSIRDARRVMRDIIVPKDERSLPPRDDHHIGQSTNAPLLPPPQKQSSSDSILLANAEKSTWLEDIKTTWGVDTVRQSGILSTSRLGLELDDYFKTLERSVLEEEQQRIHSHHVPHNAPDNVPENECPGDSSDEEEALQPHVNGSTAPSQTPTESHAPQVEHDINMASSLQSAAAGNTNGPSSLQQQVPTVMPLIPAQTPSNPIQSSTQLPIAPVPTLAPSINHRAVAPMSDAPAASVTIPSNVKSPSSSVTSAVGMTSPSVHSQSSSVVSGQPPNRMHPSPTPLQPRQAAKIAPAPPLPTPHGANGGFGIAGMSVAAAPWTKPVASQVPMKKKRGRKRKNPELTDEERLLWRKQQNRESAKLSRVRRKVIAAEYEGKLNALINENSMLRKQVDGLSNRLAYMQSLLTVSVRNTGQPPS